jgi:hypothetical protein
LLPWWIAGFPLEFRGPVALNRGVRELRPRDCVARKTEYIVETQAGSNFMPIIATSYQGLMLALQFPFSLVAVLISLVLAIQGRRSPSVGFAVSAIIFTLCGMGMELNNYGVYSFSHVSDLGPLCILFSLAAIAVCILIFGRSSNT